jgi:hypothetical protein
MSVDPTCGCCAGVTAETPVEIVNRPGLATVAYRVGVWSQFKASMLAALSKDPTLASLATRSDDDFSIALIDAWAVACDILAFYNERIVNESFLRTASETVSLRELAELIGYRLRPGVAAHAALAFTLNDPPPTGGPAPVPFTGVPTKIALDVGIKVQSVPGPGQQPATFETIEAIEARAAWNALRPRATRPYAADSAGANAVRLRGQQTGIRLGEQLLLVDRSGQILARRVVAVVADAPTVPNPTTLVWLDSGSEPAAAPEPTQVVAAIGGTLDDALLRAHVKGKRWDQTAFVAQVQANNWPLDLLESQINALNTAPQKRPTDASDPLQVFTLRVHGALFGANAPRYASLINPVQSAYSPDWTGFTLANDRIFKQFDNFPTWTFDLDGVYGALVLGGWVLLTSPEANAGAPVPLQIFGISEVTRSDYALTTRVTRLTVWQGADISAFPLDSTAVVGQTEPLDVAELPIADDVAGDTIELSGAALSLRVGQRLVITGTRSDKTGEVASEVSAVHQLKLIDGYTRITLDPTLANSYLRSTVTINANVADATHGETKREILGSGDAARAFQRFALKQTPLTYIAAANATGTISTIRVRVNGIEWKEVPYLYGAGPHDRLYTLVRDVAGTTFVQFGDGVTGERLPSGTDNVTATYRAGLGSAGMVDAGAISMLMSRPLGLNGVYNPLPSAGGGDPETLEQARASAPVTVRTLDRIVTLEDVEDFARSRAGITKAQATWAWAGSNWAACVTVAGLGGAAIDASDLDDLQSAMAAAGDGTIAIVACRYVPLSFSFAAQVGVDPVYDKAAVIAAVRAACGAAFSFDARGFAQPVFRSEIIATIQNVAGVVHVEVSALASSVPKPTDTADVITARGAALGAPGLTGGELLSIDPSTFVNVRAVP